jgi:hypothetical protein
MNKIFYIISLIVVLTTTGCQSSQITAEQAARETRLDAHTAVDVMQLPADMVVPETLPTTIQDPILLEGWIRLYNRTQTCSMWDGTTLTGQQLAQYVLDHAVVITWSTDPAYGDSSWVDRGETDNVYINTGLQEKDEMQMIRLVDTLAHEMFHRTNPFSQVEDSLYEEYWAFYVGSCVSGRAAADFDHFNPLSTASLKLWFKPNKLSAYLDEFPAYPATVVAMAIPEN